MDLGCICEYIAFPLCMMIIHYTYLGTMLCFCEHLCNWQLASSDLLTLDLLARYGCNTSTRSGIHFAMVEDASPYLLA